MKTILIQLDTDSLPSTFDRVVAVDAGVDELFSYGGVNAGNVETLVHGAMFTRGVPDLKSTAIFLGGSQVADGEALLKRVKKIFFGPMRVSVMMDSNGSNTTAAAAVLAKEGARVRVASRSVDRARQTCDAIVAAVPGAELTPVQSTSSAELEKACEGVAVVIAAGAAGVELLSADQVKGMSALKVAIDLNAVPPAGIAGVEVMDKAVERNGVLCYGAIGVGGTKMKIHKAALKKLFTANDLVLDTEAIYAIGSELG